MNDNKQKKAKIILNSEINNEVEENVPQREDDILGDPKMNFNYNFRGFKRISGWWVILFLLILISIPIGIIYIIFIISKSIINLIF
ncbi:MAG: hypothetical protein VXX35_00240 [Chloroflexota bacterium]|nr:hypothetical protein [Chloroflexota bacterium]